MKKYEYYDIKNVGEKVLLRGWVSKIRNLGGLIFIDLRNRIGIIQIVVRPESKYYDIACSLKNEYVIEVSGTILERENKNPKILSGEIEVNADKLKIINKSKEIPFMLTEDTTALEDTRLKYRYLDLRRENLKNNLIMRNNITFAIRKFLNNLDFLEVETPILCKSTPEGARDYLVPSRINKGSFFALPQSPQIFKQLLMVGGIEKYYQIAKCFRDEDLRADRQPEFTQIDVEMSFCEQKDVIATAETFLKDIFKACGKEIQIPFRQMPYKEAMENYGSDKPDLRFDLKLIDVIDIFAKSNNEIFANIAKDSKKNLVCKGRNVKIFPFFACKLTKDLGDFSF